MTSHDALPLQPEKHQASSSFDKAATSYDQVAVLQREVGKRVMERLDVIKLAPTRCYDVGCGTGVMAMALRERYKKSDVVALDLAPGMLKQARQRVRWYQRKLPVICGDAERLPLRNASCDLVVCNLALQWCNDLDAAFVEFRRILRPNGLLMFSTFGPDTLKELRASWAAVDSYPHVNAFIDMHDVGDALMRARFADPVMDVEHIVLTYGKVKTLMMDLKQLGAHNVTQGRRRGLTGKNQLAAMYAAYEKFRRADGLPATYEVVYGHAWVSDLPTKQKTSIPGVATISVDSLRKSRRP